MLFASATSGTYPDIAEKTFQGKFFNISLKRQDGLGAIGIFYPSGGPTLPGGVAALL